MKRLLSVILLSLSLLPALSASGQMCRQCEQRQIGWCYFDSGYSEQVFAASCPIAPNDQRTWGWTECVAKSRTYQCDVYNTHGYSSRPDVTFGVYVTTTECESWRQHDCMSYEPPPIDEDDPGTDLPEDEGIPTGHTPLVYSWGRYRFSAPDVLFDIDADGTLDRVSWPMSGTMLLVLDRNGNGTIDDGSELFGDHTDAGADNGFAALSAWDIDGNSIIATGDQIWDNGMLKLWDDRNHNGRSEDDELLPARDSGVLGFGLDYEYTHRRDPNGAELRLRGVVWTEHGRRNSYDAWLHVQTIED